jgi:MFS family permease
MYELKSLHNNQALFGGNDVNKVAKKVQRTYLGLTLLSTFASSFIWGINTLFLLDAGLSITETFAANAFYLVGQTIFEVPTGVVADTWGRRASFLIGTITLLVSTLFYLWMWQIQGPFWGWAGASLILGLGFTFFSGAVEAWLVDALNHAKFEGPIESVFAHGQIAGGIAMLSGSVAGGVIAQETNLGVPYVVRSVMLLLAFIFAWRLMRDEGFTPAQAKRLMPHMKDILRVSIQHGLKRPSIRWVMLASPFQLGAGVFAFYALQPYLLDLYGDPEAYGIAGLAAAIVAGAQIVGGLAVNVIRRRFSRRTSALVMGTIVSGLALAVVGLTNSFALAVIVLIVWASMFAAVGPIRQAYLNAQIPSTQRATILSFDVLIGSAGGAVAQPTLGKAADAWSFSVAYVIAGGLQLAALPFIFAARKLHAEADNISIS